MVKTKDRKRIIKMLKAKVNLNEKLTSKYISEITTLKEENMRMHSFIRSYGNYIMRNGMKKDKEEFVNLLKTFAKDKSKWL